MSSRQQAQCHCAAYTFPHRAGGGKCCANPVNPQRLCSLCLMPANPIGVDYGIGAYEYAGAPGVHRDVRTVSECCEEDLVPNGQGAYKPRAYLQPLRFPTTTGVSK